MGSKEKISYVGPTLLVTIEQLAIGAFDISIRYAINFFYVIIWEFFARGGGGAGSRAISPWPIGPRTLGPRTLSP